MPAIRANNIPKHIGGPALVAAASGLMLIPENASRHVRLHRLAALGMALTGNGKPPVSPSAVRALLKSEDIGGAGIVAQEDPYSEVLIQSVSFFGGAYLVSPGSGEHTVADLENLSDAAFRGNWMPADLQGAARQLIQGLLTVSDVVLKRAGLARGTFPLGSPRSPVYVPGAARLNELSRATFLSNDELDAHGAWLRRVIDTFSHDPGKLVDPCPDDITDDRLYIAPFLRLPDGYQVVLPLDLAITARFHLLRFAYQGGVLEELGKRWRDAAFRRLSRHLARRKAPTVLEQDELLSRYLMNIDGKRDLHILVATDSLLDWEPEVWGHHDTRLTLDRLSHLMEPNVRSTYSSARELLHLVIIDSPGRGAFWGIPNVDDADPVLMVRSDDLEVMLHHEPDGPLGLMLFAEAIDRRPGESMSTSILDEFCSYADNEKSFYLSDDAPPSFTLFQNGDGLFPRQRYHSATDLHGVIPPVEDPPVLQAMRRYERDAPEIFFIEPSGSYVGYVVEFADCDAFVTLEPSDSGPTEVGLTLLECVAYWVRECALRSGAPMAFPKTEIVVSPGNLLTWQKVSNWSQSEPAVRSTLDGDRLTLEFTETFVALLQHEQNMAERELVAKLLVELFAIASAELAQVLNKVAPLGLKRMLNSFDQNAAPDMLAANLPRPLVGHDQVMAQLLDELGEWLRSPDGANLQVGQFTGEDRVRVLNSAVGHLFDLLVAEIAVYDQRTLLDYLIAQNEALVHDAKFNSMMLTSRLACFGEQSDTVAELVEHRKESAAAQRSNRFLIEFAAAQPPAGSERIEVRDYYRLLSISKEIIDRATASDFLHYGLADIDVSILHSGRLGLKREAPVTAAFDFYVESSGSRAVRDAQKATTPDDAAAFDFAQFLIESEAAARAEFGFTFNELRDVCGGLLGLATADEITRINRADAIAEIVEARNIAEDSVTAVLDRITLAERASFLEIGADAWPWRFGRDMSYIRRPLVLQGDQLVFGFRSVYRLGPYWLDHVLSGRLQGRAKTIEMQRCISKARRAINTAFAHAVAAKLERLGMTTHVSVKKVGKRRIVDAAGQDLGDIDVLALHPETRSFLAIEAKDFEIARTPAELSNELEKLLAGRSGKKSTVELHSRRVAWLQENIDELVAAMDVDSGTGPWQVAGAVVTSDPLVTPLLAASPFPVIPFDDLDRESLEIPRRSSDRRPKRKTKHR